MRVLLIAPQVPWPPHQGTSIRNLHVARSLAARHDVTLLGFGDPSMAAPPLDEAGVRVIAVPPPPARPIGTRLVDLVRTATPDLARRLADPAMDAAVATAVSQATGPPPEIVQVEGLEMAPYGLAARAAVHAAGGRLIYDAHNAEWVLQHRAWQADLGRPVRWPAAGYSVVQTVKLRHFERRLLAAVDAAVAVSDADAAALRKLAPGTRMTVVPNGVDTAHFQPADPAGEEPGLCVFTGKMDFRPNVDAMRWFCRHAWPLVRRERPDARLAIVGRDPAPAVRALQLLPGVTVTGAVPDIRPWLARAGVVVVPLRVGGGTRLKVLEAMAMAKAIAATSMAVEGLAVADGREVALADGANALAAAIVELMAAPERRAALGRRGRARVEAEYRWAALVPAIERLYRP